MFRVVAAVLKLGNVEFVPTTNMDGTEGCAVSNDYGNERERYQTAETVAQGCQMIKDNQRQVRFMFASHCEHYL
jgi:hypothetical protein